jgi:uncharacterized protein (DUF4415 family)
MKTLVSPVPELSEFESELLESVRQALTGGFVGQTVEYSPTAIAAIKKRGRPTGSSKRATTLRIDEGALTRWRATGKGWQTRAAQVLAIHAPA